MDLKKRLQRKKTLTVLEIKSLIIVTMLSTLLLITNWPRFLSDAMEVKWYLYVVVIIIFAKPLLKKK